MLHYILDVSCGRVFAFRLLLSEQRTEIKGSWGDVFLITVERVFCGVVIVVVHKVVYETDFGVFERVLDCHLALVLLLFLDDLSWDYCIRDLLLQLQHVLLLKDVLLLTLLLLLLLLLLLVILGIVLERLVECYAGWVPIVLHPFHHCQSCSLIIFFFIIIRKKR